MPVTIPTSPVTPTRSNVSLIAAVLGVGAAGFALFVVLIALVAVAALFVSGTIQHTSQGWVFHNPTAERLSTQMSRELATDPSTYRFLRDSGTGSGRTATFTADTNWTAIWAYDCPTSAGQIALTAHAGTGSSYAAGQVSNDSHALGQSPHIPAGTYWVSISTNPGCTWALGARPASK